MAILGIAFRATAGYVTGASGDTYSLGEAYPVTRGGLTFGFSASSTGSARDRATDYPRQAGIVFKTNGGTTLDFKVDLPSGAGTYKLRLSAGDPTAAQAPKVVVKDGSTVLATLSASTGAGSTMDITGAVVTRAAWDAAPAEASFTFSGTQLVLTIGDTGGSGSFASVLSYLSVEYVPAADVTPPTMTGSITVGTVTTTSIDISWPAGSDNVAVTSYEVSKDGGSTWTDTASTGTSYSFTGLTPSTSYPLRVRAKDAAANVSTPLAITQSTATPSDSTPPTLTGSITIGTVTSSSIVASWPAGADNVAVTSYETSLDGTTWTDRGNVLTYTFTGLSPSTSYTIRVRAKDGSANVSTPALSATQSTSASSDATAPTLTGSITISNVSCWGFRAAWPAATDNVAVTGYEVSTDAGSTWQDVGPTRLVKGFVNHAWKGTTVQLRVRAYDAAGNRSGALSYAVAVPTDAGSTVVRRSINPAGGADFTSLQGWNDAAPSDLTVNVSSTCQAGSTTSAVVLNAAASAVTRAYVNNTLTIGGETRLITAYDPSTKVATIGAVNSGDPAAFSTAPASGASYTIGPVIWQGEVPNIEISGSTNGTTTYFMNMDGAITSAMAYKHLTAAPGAAWCDHANVLTNALRYNAANGAAITWNAGSLSGTTIDLTSGGGGGYCRLSRLQVRSTGNNTSGWGGYAVHTSSAEKPCWVDRCIMESGTWDFVYSPNYGSHLLTNSVVIGTRPASAQATHTADSIAELNNGSMVFNSLFVAINGQTYQRASVARTNNVEFVNTGFFGVGLVQDLGLSGAESPGPRYYNCFSDAGSLPSGVTYAALNTTTGAGFQNITYGSHDLRIKSTSALRDSGASTTGLPSAVDAAGTARPQGAAWDVGPWEFIATAGPGTITFSGANAFKDYAGAVLANVTIPRLLVIDPTSGTVILNLTSLTTGSDGSLTINNAALVAGTTYAVTAFNSSVTQRGINVAVAA